MRRFAGPLLVAYLGCQGMHGAPRPADRAASEPAGTHAAHQWEKTQPPEVVRSAEPPPVPAVNSSDSADFDRETLAFNPSRPEDAARILQQYLAKNPRHLAARAELAELCLRQARYRDARLQFRLLAYLAEDQNQPDLRHLVHSHSRLVEVAEALDEEFGQNLHRGIGLYWLAIRRSSEPATSVTTATPDDLPVDSILGRAIDALQMARDEDRSDPRCHWYLFRVWTQLGQHSAAIKSLRQADALAISGRLSPAERRGLQLACLEHAAELAGSRASGR